MIQTISKLLAHRFRKVIPGNGIAKTFQNNMRNLLDRRCNALQA